MLDGTIENSAKKGKQLQVIQFQSETLNLDQFSGPAQLLLAQARGALSGRAAMASRSRA